MSFSSEFRKNVTPAAAAAAMLYIEELEGGDHFARALNVAFNNVDADLAVLRAEYPQHHLPKDAVAHLMDEARSSLRMHEGMMPDQAVTQFVASHQERLLPNAQALKDRVAQFEEARAMAVGILGVWARTPA